MFEELKTICNIGLERSLHIMIYLGTKFYRFNCVLLAFLVTGLFVRLVLNFSDTISLKIDNDIDLDPDTKEKSYVLSQTIIPRQALEPPLPQPQREQQEPSPQQQEQTAPYNNSAQDPASYNRNIPLIWIGGVPRSGTTLMRAMLDAHPDVRCGEETRIIPRLLGLHDDMLKSKAEVSRLKAANIDEALLNPALGAHLLTIITKHGGPAQRLCNKDPYTLRHTKTLRKLFPNSKFLLMIRDGRAVVDSILSRHVNITGFFVHRRNHREGLARWNTTIAGMYGHCVKHGPSVCLPVYYEQLVLHPEQQMRRVLDFLDLPWNDSVLHHEEKVGKENGVSLSNKEVSTNQVARPVNTLELNKWADHIPVDVRIDIESIAPMLKTLGYDPYSYPPNYGTPDKLVEENTKRLMG